MKALLGMPLLAISGGLDYAPHVGDPVHVVGRTASRGALYGEQGEGLVTLYLSRERRVTPGHASGMSTR